ncbi:MAG TPA: biopolymer transporter ExbD [Chthoniobacterales bacterium]
MIDVVFVIMLFFMVMAGAVKVEKELNIDLPGVADTDAPVNFVDEQIITVSDVGDVTLNDEPMDSPQSAQLPQLTAALSRLRQSAEAAKSPLVVTIVSDQVARYSRAIQVLDALAAARIEAVTFTVSDDE